MKPANIGQIGHVLALAAALLLVPVHSAPTVDVSLQAAFDAPPFLVELLETAAGENATSYHPLLDRVAEGHFDTAKTDKELYELFLSTLQDDGHITDSESLSSFKLALSVHSAAPRVEAHYQYYNTTARYRGSKECDTWVVFDSKKYCTPDLASEATESVSSSSVSHSLPFDRVLGDDKATSSILYADITSSNFRKFHKTISLTAKSGKTSYRVRHKPAVSGARKPLSVSGYGVELALKRTDYIVIDDRQAAEGAKKETAEKGQAVLADDEVADLKPLSSSELVDLGLKAASFVMASEDKFGTLLKLAQDFPKHSKALSTTEISEQIKNELSDNAQSFLPPGYNAMWINGRQTLDRDLDAFSLLEQLRSERKLINSAKSLGLTGDETIKLIGHADVSGSSGADGGMPDVQRYDWRDDIEENNVIIWMNNIEKDKRYLEWPDNVQAFLQRMFPGQLPAVRKDLNNVVLPVDFSNKTDVELILENLQNYVKRKVPIRFGLVPITISTEAEQYAKVILSLTDTYGLAAALHFLELSFPDMGKKAKAPVQSYYEAAIKEKTLRKERQPVSFQDARDSDMTVSRIELTRSYLKRLGAAGSSPPYIANGVPIPRGEAWMALMSNQVSMDTRMVQQAIYMGKLDDSSYLPSMFLENATPRRNPFIIPEDEKDIKLLTLSNIPELKDGLLGSIPSVPASEETVEAELVQLVVVANFDTEEGNKLFQEAVKFRGEHDSVELFFAASGPAKKGGFSERLHGSLTSTAPTLQILQGLEWNATPADGQEQSSISVQDFWGSASSFLNALGLPSGTSALVLNGRVVGPVPQGASVDADDMDMLLAYERKKRLLGVGKALKALDLLPKASKPYSFARLSNLVALSQISDVPEGIFEGPPSTRMSIFEQLKGEFTGITLGDSVTSSVQVVLALDPASEVAQHWLPVIRVLSELTGVYVKLFLNPKERLEELPVKRFYRHVLQSAPSFDASGSLADQSAHFTGLPADALLNIGMDLPSAWLVSPKDSVHDLDNLRLSSLKSDQVKAIYQLDHILIEGHSQDATAGSAPRGAQLILGTGKDEHFADTIIMANLGYFQFKANPGFYNLSLQQGRSQEIFHIDSAGLGGYNAQTGDSATEIALTSFRGTTLFPRLSRKAGMEEEDVLEPSKSTLEKTVDSLADAAGNVLNAIGMDKKGAGDWLSKATQKVASLSNGGVGSKAVSTLPHADINIFSVASGHLYERMLNIMMVSVMKHTSHTVKFWFIEQFLSPSFKAFLPILAEEYGFRYEMVTYKWPHWLRSQKEKQREIWGYKILFLDVLFPLDLDKVIFVDADQIVRTDMYELVQYDLKGAPYGFTPMCDSRTEMEGYRFWKQGYWKSFLRGLPYHISALYVVDLVKFRQMAAGDRLRQQYHQLSADPQSLSNLDQDLPNHLQHVLPIHSLPQEWLWCETWCSDESQGVAKTIDLCNNPETKEPKLERAKRQVPEWTVYDGEIASLAKRKQGEEAVVPGLGQGKGEQERLQAEEYQRKKEEEEKKVRLEKEKGNKPRDEL
ncbi:UDP-glucose:glycoprotein glucosyltransferase [Elsinoe australis]|uniref:UDP-glucose:glycoprotein glucosyltransferase n=1 Tax=Elsinoe australis TaxID=40998 RepID=A0A4U7B3B1_9PEZI|nr:UDP-glucose:glycoprotein glucosyltransferase [Elsinoe australis]